MSQLFIEGNAKLQGEIKISGAKNAALKILPAALLAKTPSVIHNVPDILDIEKMKTILESLGAKVKTECNSVVIDPTSVNSNEPEASLVHKLRGSIVVVGPLLARFGKASISQPGGCLIGARPIDDHLDVFKQLGIKISRHKDSYHFEGRPKAAQVVLNKMSVTATENAIMASVLASGTTKIHVAAAEPEILDLANYLNTMGAKITGAGTHTITIEGVKELHGREYTIIPDRIEAGTYLAAAIGTNSSVMIGPVIPDHLAIVLRKLELMGASHQFINKGGNTFIKTDKCRGLKAIDIDTRTYPGFPTDLQSPFVALLTQAQGQSRVFETIFENRFLYLSELTKMGARVEQLSPHIIEVTGASKLRGRKLYCQDIRGGAALVVAALVADGETHIDQCEFIDRGYERIDEKLANAGVRIKRSE